MGGDSKCCNDVDREVILPRCGNPDEREDIVDAAATVASSTMGSVARDSE